MENFIKELDTYTKKNKINRGLLSKFLTFIKVDKSRSFTIKKDKLEQIYLKGFNTIELFKQEYERFDNQSNPDDTFSKIKNFLNQSKCRILCNKLNIKISKRKVNDLKKEIVEYCRDNNKDLDWIKETLKSDRVLETTEITENKSQNKKYKHIIHIADLHIRRNERINEYKKVFDNFLKSLINNKSLNMDNTLITVCGDIFHYKTTQKSGGIKLWFDFIIEVCKHFQMVCIPGNHDLLLQDDYEIFDNVIEYKILDFKKSYKINRKEYKINNIDDFYNYLFNISLKKLNNSNKIMKKLIF
jgi:hypothetical protein